MLYRLDRSQTPPTIVQVYPKDLRVDAHRRRVILFPGSGLDDSVVRTNPKNIVGSFKYVEQALASSLESQKEPVDVFLYTYENSHYEAEAQNLNGKSTHYRMGRETDAHYLPSKYGRTALRDMLCPMLLEPGETFRTIAPATLKQRLGTFTLCAHSFGSVMSQHLADALVYELRQAGWQEAAIREVTKQVVSVNVANIARTDYPQPNFTQYFFMSANDTAALSSIKRQCAPEDYLQQLRQCGYPRIAAIMERHATTEVTPAILQELREEVAAHRHRGEMPKPILRQVDSGYTVHAMLPDDEIRWIERNSDGRDVCRTLNKEEAERIGTPVVHDFRTFLHGNHRMGELLINVLNNAVEREPGVIGDGHTLLQTTPQTMAQHHVRKVKHERALVSERGIVHGVLD